MRAIGNSKALLFRELSKAVRGMVDARARKAAKRSDVFRFARLIRSLALPIFLLFLSICGLAQGPNEAERIHYGDVIDVDFVGGFEFDWRGGLTPSGDLDGLAEAESPIHALCKTEQEVAAEVTKAYAKILREPRVNVRIVDRSGRAVVRLYGAVRSPARFKLMRPVHLRELVILAGGLTDAASGEISIFRPENLGCDGPDTAESASKTLKIQISDVLAGKTDSDPTILTGDIITVEKAPALYVIGAVNNPRPIFSRQEMTVSRAIATAGGIAKEADGKRATILRRDGVETKIIEVDLAGLKTDPSKDVVLKPSDIIDVASRGGGKRKLPPFLERQGTNSTQAEPPLRIVD